VFEIDIILLEKISVIVLKLKYLLITKMFTPPKTKLFTSAADTNKIGGFSDRATGKFERCPVDKKPISLFKK